MGILHPHAAHATHAAAPHLLGCGHPGLGNGPRVRPAGCDDVVDPQDHGGRLGRRVNSLRLHAERLQDTALEHVHGFTLEHVEAEVLTILLLVLAPELDQHVDRVQAAVLREGPRYDVQGAGERLDGKLLPAADRCRIVPEPQAELDLGCASAGYDLLILYYNADDSQGIVQGALILVHGSVGAAPQ